MNKVGEFLRAVRERDPGVAFILVNAVSFFGGGFFGSTYMNFLMKYLGNEAAANSVNMWFMAGIVVLEVPTGAIADVFGRKLSTVLGTLFWAISTLIYFVSRSYSGFALAEICAAASYTMVSGAFISWMIDWVGERRSRKILSWKGTIRIATIPSGVLGGIVGAYSLEMPWLLSGIFGGLATFATILLMRGEPETCVAKQPQSLITTARDGLLCVLKNRVVALLVLASGIQIVAFQAFNMFWPLVFLERLGGQENLGILMALISVTLAFGSFLAGHKLVAKQTSVMELTIPVVVVGGAMLVGTLFPITSVLSLTFLIHEVGRGMAQTIFVNFANKYIPSPIRATANSAISMVEKIGAFVGLGISGLIASRFGPLFAWKVSAILILLTIPLLIAAGRRDGS